MRSYDVSIVDGQIVAFGTANSDLTASLSFSVFSPFLESTDPPVKERCIRRHIAVYWSLTVWTNEKPHRYKKFTLRSF